VFALSSVLADGTWSLDSEGDPLVLGDFLGSPCVSLILDREVAN